MSTTTAPHAEGIHWDLTRLFPDDASARAHLTESLQMCSAFAQRYRGAVAGLDAAGMAALLNELGDLDNRLSRIGSYAHLRESTDVSDEANLDLSAAVDRAYVEASNHLRFFELEWLEVPDAAAARIYDAPELSENRHYLVAMRRFAPHTLSEPEERMLAERAPAATAAWESLYTRVTSTLETPFDPGDGPSPHSIDRLLAYMRHDERDVRLRAIDALYGMLEPHTTVLAHCYDTLVGDRLAMDKLRHYDDPMDATHLRNELSGEVVDAMLAAVERNYPVAQRWFRAKAGFLGLEKLTIADQYAPIVSETRDVRFDEAARIVSTAFRGFSPVIADIADAFVAEHRIDAEPRTGKRGGAYCSRIAQDARPYVLMNYTDQMNDVLTLAHELGHGMHFHLSNTHQTPLSSDAGIAMCEIASTFAEHITYDYLLANEQDPDTRRSLAYERVEGAFATIFRQAVLARYEQAAYRMRAEGITLTADRLAAAWVDENTKYYGDSMVFPDGYRWGWSYIPHFIHTRFYTYGYAFALLVSLVLTARYRAQGEAFVGQYLDLLAAGGNGSPQQLLERLGLDLTDAATWDAGFAEVARMIDEAQAA